MLSVQWYHHHYVKVGPVCKKVQTFPCKNILYIRTDRKEKFWVQNSWWFRANKLSSQYFTERTSFIIAINKKSLDDTILEENNPCAINKWSRVRYHWIRPGCLCQLGAGCVVNSSRSCAADDEWWGDGECRHPGGDQGNQGESPGKSRLQRSVGEQEKR